MIRELRVRAHGFADVVTELTRDGDVISSATGGDFTSLVLLGKSLDELHD